MNKELDKPIQVTQELEEQIQKYTLNFIKGKTQCCESKTSLIYNFIHTKTCRTVTDANEMFRGMIELGLDLELVEPEYEYISVPNSPTEYNLRQFADLRGWC